MAIAECDGRMCGGSLDGSIRVWDGATLEHERTLHVEDEEDSVRSLAAWEGHLISGYYSGVIRVWNVATGACNRKLEGHTGAVRCLAVSGTRLVSGSDDRSVKVWAMGAGASWPCERTLVGHTDWIRSLATWQGKVLSGSDDASVRVWDVGTGAHDATLTGHERRVYGLAVHGNRLLSASIDGTIREWALGTWAAVRIVEVFGRGGGQYVSCLAVSGSKLISGSGGLAFSNVTQQYEVRVWDLGTLECEHRLQQPAGEEVGCLAAGCGVVLGGVGKEVVVWGRA
jgi:F-box/WD-40 domain protein 7